MFLEPFLDKPCGIILLKKSICNWIHCCHEGCTRAKKQLTLVAGMKTLENLKNIAWSD
jgi:hypothetical protein